MTSKGLVIGDSHAGMLIDATQDDQSGALAAIELDYFVQPGSGPRDFEVQGTRLIAKDPLLIAFLDKIAARQKPDLAEYDFLIIVGCQLSIYSAVQTLGSLALVGSGQAIWQELRQYGGSGLEPYKRQFVSHDCYQQVIRDKLSAVRFCSLLGEISRISTLPIFVVPQPRPRTLLLTLPKRGSAFSRIHKSGDGQSASTAFDSAMKSLCDPVATCQLLTQPEDTISDFIFTKEQFFEGAVRLSNPGMSQAKRDVLHTNAQYGAQVLQQLCTILGISPNTDAFGQNNPPNDARTEPQTQS